MYTYAMSEAPVVVAKVFIRYQWIKNSSLDRLLMPMAENKNPSLSGLLVLPVTRFDLSDNHFAEVAFTQAQLEFEGVLYVPKTEMLAIVKTMKPEDMEKVGHRTLG